MTVPCRTLVHILCGSAGGCAGTLLSFPFDVLRSRLVAQSRTVYRGALDGTRLLYSEAGLPTFYRGLTAALLAVAPQSGLQFGLYSLYYPKALRQPWLHPLVTPW